jgi:flagellar basal-body rod modification protein FlgD
MVNVTSYLNGLGYDSSKPNEQKKDLGKDDFLNLLVTQMTNQNPLEPMGDTEFLAQMAQFSSLEQMQNIASGMDMLALTQTAATNSQMVNLIGKRVLIPGSEISLDGKSPIDITFHLDGNLPPSANIEIKDASGTLVRTISVNHFENGKNKIVFDGKDNSGVPLEKGNYSYRLVTGDDSEIESLTTYSNYYVDAVAYEGTNILLKSDNATINLSDIHEVIGGN